MRQRLGSRALLSPLCLSSPRLSPSLAPLIAPLLAGCAPALSTFTPAHVAPRGHVQAEIGSDVSYPTGTLADLKDGADALSNAAQDRELTEEEQHRVLRGAASTLLNPPSFNTHLGIGVGVYDNTEVQGRLTSGGWRLGGRYQLLSQDSDRVDLSAGIGVSHYTFSLGLPEIPSVLKASDYSRWLLDVPVLLGKHGTWYRWWAGPKFLVGSFDASITLAVPTDDTAYDFTMEGTSWYLGGQAGAALGYKWIFVAAELTVVHCSTSARFRAPQAGIEPYEPSLGGTIWYPGIGLMGEF